MLLDDACEWATGLRASAIPDDVRALARAQLLSNLGARHTGARHQAGPRVARPFAGEGWAPAAAAAAALSIALDFDETLFAGHTGHSAVQAPLACAAELGADGEALLVAMVGATEVATRVTAALTLGRVRGQTAGHTHATAAVVGCGLLLGLGVGELAAALDLALGQPRSVLLPAFMGSDAKFSVAAVPVLDAARCLAQAAGGARGQASFEGRGGLLESVADVPLPEALSGFGERWHLRTLSIKVVPGCAYLTAAVEAAATLAPLDLAAVEDVEVGASVFTMGMEAESAPFIAGPASPLPALGFSAGYNVAAALESGGLGPADLEAPALESAARWGLAGRVRVVHDPELTVAALAATAPIGAALGWAGERARPYLDRRGGGGLADRVLEAARAQLDDPTFEHPSKRVGARLRVRLRDGRLLEVERDAARGCCQEPVADRVALAEAKFAAASGSTPPGDIAGLSAAEVAALALVSSPAAPAAP